MAYKLNAHANYLDLTFIIDENNKFYTKLYDKHDDFNFTIRDLKQTDEVAERKLSHSNLHPITHFYRIREEGGSGRALPTHCSFGNR